MEKVLIKICCISDTHGYLPQQLPECDILLHAGDITHQNEMGEQAIFMNTKFKPWWDAQKASLKYFIAGNHDFVFEQFAHMLDRQTLHGYLQDGPNKSDKWMPHSIVDIPAPNVWGTPWVPRYGHWAFMAPDDFLSHKFKLIPQNTDIILSHGPPKYIMDKNRDGEHCGSLALAQAVFDIKPKLVVFGHIHEGREKESVVVKDGTTFVNASLMNGNFRPNNEPVVLEIEI